MSTILFECDVTEYSVQPPKENDENAFALNDNALVINFMNTHKNKILMQSEISKEHALELAKLIIFKYGMKC